MITLRKESAIEQIRTKDHNHIRGGGKEKQMIGKISLKLNTKPLSKKLSQLIYHLNEAQKLIDSINSMEAKDLVDRSDKNQ